MPVQYFTVSQNCYGRNPLAVHEKVPNFFERVYSEYKNMDFD
jgi:hypothetical protein